jgi:hypothetical protein
VGSTRRSSGDLLKRRAKFPSSVAISSAHCPRVLGCSGTIDMGLAVFPMGVCKNLYRTGSPDIGLTNRRRPAEETRSPELDHVIPLTLDKRNLRNICVVVHARLLDQMGLGSVGDP